MRGSLSLLVVLLALVSIIGLVMGGALMLPTDLGLGGWEPIDVDRNDIDERDVTQLARSRGFLVLGAFSALLALLLHLGLHPARDSGADDARRLERLESRLEDVLRAIARLPSSTSPAPPPEHEPAPLTRPRPSLEALIMDLRHEHEAVRRAAARELRQRGADARDALPELLDTLERPDESLTVLRAVALAALDLAPRAEEVVPTLVRRSRSGDLAVRQWAVTTLGRIGPRAAVGVTEIVPLLEDPDLGDLVADALRRIGSREARRALSDSPSAPRPRESSI
jgi:hypothetical protein